MLHADYVFSDLEQEEAVELTIQQTWAAVHEHVDCFRKKSGLSYEELGARIGASKSQVHAWLSGPSNMTVRSAARLLLAAEADLILGVRTWKDIEHQVQRQAEGLGDSAHGFYAYGWEAGTAEVCEKLYARGGVYKHDFSELKRREAPEADHLQNASAEITQ